MASYMWAHEEKELLEAKWGIYPIPTIAEKLNRSPNAIIQKAKKIGLGPFLMAGEYITVTQLFRAIGRSGGTTYTLRHWVKKGFPLKTKRVLNGTFKIVSIEEFWSWAAKYRMHIDFSKFDEGALGKEPIWVKEQRKADIAFNKYKKGPWTKAEDERLRFLCKEYRYSYKEISMMMLRTEGAIRRRMGDLAIDNFPLREPQHSIWTEEQIKIVMNMYRKGYRSEVIKEYIDKSAHAIEGKISRLIKDGILKKWR